MKKKSSQFITVYMKLTVKMPVTIVLVILLGSAAIYWLASTTDTLIYKTYQGTVYLDENNNPSIRVFAMKDEKITNNDKAYWYKDKKDKIHKAVVTKQNEGNGNNIITIYPESEDMLYLDESSDKDVTVELIIGRTSLLKKILGKVAGGVE